MSKGKVVVGVIGNDIHIKGARILEYGLRQAGFNVVGLGIFCTQKDFIEAAIETKADAILVSSLYGMGEIDCRGFRDKCEEAGLKDILLYAGGFLQVGSRPWQETGEIFRAMGFDRIYPPGTRPQQAAEDLERDLAARGKVAEGTA